MSVLLQTSLGDIVIDLYTSHCPKTSLNFIKLCKVKHYNNALFYCIEKDFLVQVGNMTSNISIFGYWIISITKGQDYQYFEDEINPQIQHNRIGIVSMSNQGPNLNASNVRLIQFFITLTALGEDFDTKHTAFGIVEEGLNILENINQAICEENGRPFRDIRIKHTYILDDPFDDIPLMIVPDSPLPVIESDRLLDDENIEEFVNETQIRESIKEHEAKARAVILEMLGDLPDANIAPPENVAFICKLHHVTTDQDLYLLFSRFGPIKSCEVIRDYKTGNSLQYGFIEFENIRDCEEAVLRMDGVLVDGRRIRVDFSQSVARLWKRYRRGRKIASKNNEIRIKDTPHNIRFKQDRHKMVFDDLKEKKSRSRSR